MVSSNKILTVSYGTFSCTLEGFDDSFDTMKAIAEYFRDLAADDRYFGAEPPTPDAEMLARIAEREISRRVEARQDESGIILRASLAAPEAAPAHAATTAMRDAAPQALQEPAHEPSVSNARTEPQQAEPQQAEPSSAVASSDPTPTDVVAAPATPEDDTAAARSDAALPAAPEQPETEAMAAPAQGVEAAETAEPVEPRMTRETSGTEQDAADTVADQAGAVAHAVSEIVETVEVEAPAGDSAPSEPAPSEPAPEPVAELAEEVGAEAIDAPRPSVPESIAAKLQRIRAVVSRGAAVTEGRYAEDQHAEEIEPAPREEVNLFLDEAAGENPEAEAEAPRRTRVLRVKRSDLEAAVGGQSALAALVASVTGRDMSAQDGEARPAPREELVETAGDGFQPATAPDAAEQADAEPLEAADDGAFAEPAEPEAPHMAETRSEDAADLPGTALTPEQEADLQRELAAALGAFDETDEAFDTEDAKDETTEAAFDWADDGWDEEDPQEAVLAAVRHGLDADAFGAEAALDDAPRSRAGDDLTPAAIEEAEAETEERDGPEIEPESRAEIEAAEPEAWDEFAEERSAIDETAEDPLAEILAAAQEQDDRAEDAQDDPYEDEHAETGEEEAPLAPETLAAARRTVRLGSEAHAMLTSRPVEQGNGDVSRLLDETNTQMDEPEASRRRSAIAHLRAAVAATRADRLLGGRGARRDEAERYRDDLAQAVRPRRPEAPASRTARPAEMRPAPLKLVAEQRVDAEAAAARRPVQPRRVTADLDEAVETATEGGFSDFAREMGATELPDLLEAAAAYLSFVEGRDEFSRPQLMTKVRQVENEEFSREDGLRSFGQLLREGKIEKIRGGRFTVSDRIGFRPDARAAG